MSLNANRNSLLALTRDLHTHWNETKAAWRDSRSREFDERYMQELMSGVEKTLPLIEQLDQLLHQIRHDCE